VHGVLRVDSRADSRVAANTCSSAVFLGAPGRSSSTSRYKRRSTNRECHWPTVGLDTPNDAATSTLDDLLAHASTARLPDAND
jgi:hypothetical protein